MKYFKRRDFIKTMSLTSISVLPGIETFGGLINTSNQNKSYSIDTRNFIDFACRILQYQNLLYLEYYFVNVKLEKDQLLPITRVATVSHSTKKVPTKSFMIVRLPQQHIAEEFFTSAQLNIASGPVYAHTVISGYSFLVFEILFAELQNQRLAFSVSSLLNWNAKHFSLVVKEDPKDSLFNLLYNDTSSVGNYKNEYPLGYVNGRFNRNAFPKYDARKYISTSPPTVYTNDNVLISDADPATAIEVPYRLIISPRLPDPNAYRYYWTFSYPAVCNESSKTTTTELWTAALSIRKRNKTSIPTADSKDEQNRGLENEGDNQMQLMLIGSPDDSLTRPEYENDEKCGFLKLPCGRDRSDLVFLFLRGGGITARSERLTFSPLGISTSINFRNYLFEKNSNSLYQWNQKISFGRDEQVTVSRIVVEATLGLKMLHVQTTNRETFAAQSVLVYREFLAPLDPSKDFSLYDNNAHINQYKDANWKFNSPMQKVGFRDMKPIEIRPVMETPDLVVTAPQRASSSSQRITDCDCANQINGNVILAFYPVTLDGKLVAWPMFFNDWHDNTSVDGDEDPLQKEEPNLSGRVEFSKKLFILTSELSQYPDIEMHYTKIDNSIQTFSELSSEIFSPITEDVLHSEFVYFRNRFKDHINRITSQPWTEILRKSEDFDIQSTDYYRQYIELTLSSIEEKLREKAGAITDQVIEEWNSFKRKVLSNEKDLISLLDRIIISLEKDGALFSAPNAVLSTLETNAKTLRDEILKEIERDAASAMSSVLNYRNRILAFMKPILVQAPANAYSVLQQQFITLTHAFEEKVSPYHFYVKEIENITESIESLGFEYDSKIFFSRMTPEFVKAIQVNINKGLSNLKQCLNELQHVEENLKNKVDIGKRKVGYAVSYVEGELNDLKKALMAGHPNGWEEEYDRLRKLYHREVNEQISKLQTDYIVFRSNYRHFQKEFGDKEKYVKKVFNFFDEYSCFPQMFTAKVHIDAVNDLVHRDIPVKIKYAEDYFKNQVNNKVLEVTNNAAKVFAQIKTDAKELIRGAVKEISHEIGGFINPEIAADFLTYAKEAQDRLKQLEDFLNQAQNFEDEAKKRFGEIKKELLEPVREFEGHLKGYQGALRQAKNSFILISDQAKKAIKEGENQAKAYFQGLEAKILGAIHIKDIVGKLALMPRLERRGDSLTYSFVTDDLITIPPNQLFSFTPVLESAQKKGNLILHVEKSITTPSKYSALTSLNNFTVGIFSDRVVLGFEKLEIYSDNNVKNKISVELKSVHFNKELKFIEALSKSIKIPGTGLSINIHPQDISIDFAYALPAISGGAFNFFNAKFIVGVILPLPIGRNRVSSPIQAKFGINTPDDKFVLGVGIWGGRGHCVIEATPKYIKGVDIGMDYGGLLALSLGIAQGQAFLMAGVRYVYRRDDFGNSSMELYAIVTCGGTVTVFGFITISVVFILCLKYEKNPQTSTLYGIASVSYSIEIGFFKKSFTLTYSKRLAGSDASGSQDLASNQDRNRRSLFSNAIWSAADMNDRELYHYIGQNDPINYCDEYSRNELKLVDRYHSGEWKKICKIYKFN